MAIPRADGALSEEYWAVKARREKILADRDELELDLVKGKLVIADDVHKAAFLAARKLRDTLHGICKQSSPAIAALNDPVDIERHLKAEIDRALEEFIENCA